MRLPPSLFPILLGHILFGGEAPVAEKVSQRGFPSVFQAWNGASPIPGKTPPEMMARHDLVFTHPLALGLKSETPFEGSSLVFTTKSLEQAKAKRAALLAQNPNLILLAEIRYRDAPKGFLPDDSPCWKRDAKGAYVMGWAEGGYRLLDVSHPDWQTQVAARAKAVMETGVFDGVMLDWWRDDPDRLSLIFKVRGSIGPQPLVLVNSNDEKIPLTAGHVNGLFMECYRTETPRDWERVSETLRWAETSLRTPRVNCLETWFHESRQDLHLMRAVTTLALTQSDGYCLFSDPNGLPTPDHQHDWYPFWDKGLGKPVSPGMKRADGSWQRAFSGGTAVYNPPGGHPATISFPTPQRSRATGKTAAEHTVPPSDGDLFLTP